MQIMNYCLLIFSLAMLYIAYDTAAFNLEELLISFIFPVILLTFMSVLSIILIVKQKKVESKISFSWALSKRYIPILALIIYIIAFRYIGYWVATIIFMGGFLYLLGEKRRIKILGVSVISVIILFFVFAMGMSIQFPMGIGIFEYMSSLITSLVYLN